MPKITRLILEKKHENAVRNHTLKFYYKLYLGILWIPVEKDHDLLNRLG